MMQMTLGDFAAVGPVPKMTENNWTTMCVAMESIAASTLMEFDNALLWAQWCRRAASTAIAASKR